MAVPKRRTSRARQGNRRSHHAVSPRQLQYCPACKEPAKSHFVCGSCGFFQGRTVIVQEEEEKTGN